MAARQPSAAAVETPVSRESRFRRITGTLGKRNFRLFWIGETTSQIGSNISSVVIPLVGVRVLHAGTFAVALLTGAVWLPWLLFGLLAGAWVDRFPKRTVMIICDLISLVLFASIAICAWLGVLTLAQLLTASLLAGLVSVFFKAAFQAYIPQLLRKDELIDGNAKLQASAAFATVSGPGIGGAVAQVLGIATGVIVDAASFAVSAICLFATRTATPDQRHRGPGENSARRSGRG